MLSFVKIKIWKLIINKDNNINAKPFLRWAGGKSWLTKIISQYIPENFNDYYEPFLGGGSVFFYLKTNNYIQNDSFLSDVNPHLISSYKVIRDSPEMLIECLKKFNNDSITYYIEREKKYESPIQEAARFIYLNRTSFNGIYRENLKGKYNVPYGHKVYKSLFDFDNLRNVSESLKKAEFYVSDFSKIMSNSKKGDLVFIDPPYTVAHENNGFVKYNQKIFTWEDQIRLKDCILELEKKGVYYILTNAYHSSLIDLYDSIGFQNKLERFSVVGGINAKREKYHEIIISNVNNQKNI